MSETNLAPGGSDQAAAGGAPENKEPETVLYVTHQKTLTEKKRFQEEALALRERVAAFEKHAKESAETDLKAKEEFKKLAELRAQELEETKALLNDLTVRQQNAAKLDAFLHALDGKVDRKYWGHIDLGKIVIDPSTGEVDNMSVTKEVEAFKKTYFEIIQRPNSPGMPNNQPNGSQGSSLTLEQWKQLPAKEMRARYNDVVKKT